MCSVNMLCVFCFVDCRGLVWDGVCGVYRINIRACSHIPTQMHNHCACVDFVVLSFYAGCMGIKRKNTTKHSALDRHASLITINVGSTTRWSLSEHAWPRATTFVHYMVGWKKKQPQQNGESGMMGTIGSFFLRETNREHRGQKKKARKRGCS